MKTALPRVVILFLLLASSAFAQQPRMVDAKRKPSDAKWTAYPTRAVEDLPAAVRNKKDTQLSQYGGLVGRKLKATGFFYPTQVDGRWWLVDPDGCLFLHKAVVSVRPLTTAGAKAAMQKKFGDAAGWAAKTNAMLWQYGFNGTGAWSDTEPLRAAPRPQVYTKMWNFMSSYGRKRGGTFQQPGHTGYPNDCIFVFDPDFEKFCDEQARQLAADKEDPWLLGHFSDNEMPLKRAALENYLKLPESEPGRRAAQEWLQKKHGPNAAAKDITEKDREEFLAHVVDRYYGIVGRAIKKYDPNHLYLGSRFYGSDLRYPEIFRAAGPHLDVVAVNYYGAWTPDPERLAMWARESGKPIAITEWYAKGADTGMENTSGAGWLVKTQADRGLFYQNFTLGLLESKVCVGWHWFKYQDNDPADTKADPSNRDSNKGIVDAKFEEYQALTAMMLELNERAYSLVDYFDKVDR